MPDLQNFSITRNGNVTVSVPKYNITCDVCDSTHGNVLRSFNVNFPNILANLTDDQLDDLFIDFINMIIKKRVERNF